MGDFLSVEREYHYASKDLSYNNPKIFWNTFIKNDKNLLKWATSFLGEKNKDKEVVNGPFISLGILLNYKDIDEDVYYEFIDLIYSNLDVARTNIDDNLSYLLLSLWNKDIKLNEKQKEFAVNEALNNDGVHGKGPFDLRFYILNSSSWDLHEKKKLVYDFYSDDVWYDYLEEFEWSAINEAYSSNDKVPLNISCLYDYDYEYLLNTYGKDVCDQIEFCKVMNEIRPCIKKSARRKL